MIKSDEVFKIGQFAKPHGIKGEITLMTDCDVLMIPTILILYVIWTGFWFHSFWRIIVIRHSHPCC